jgi:hypothetical protein
MRRLFFILVLLALLIASGFAARSFNGSTDLVSVSATGTAADITGTELTLFAWVYPVANGTNFGICAICKWTVNTHRQYALVYDDQGDCSANNDILVAVGGGGGSWLATKCQGTLTQNAWNTIGATFKQGDSASLVPWINCTAGSGSGQINSPIGSGSNNLTLGNPVFGNETTGSKIAYAAEWDIKLTNNEMTALSKGILPPCVHGGTHLKGYWVNIGLNSPEGDFSGNVNGGTVTGTSVVSGGPPVQPCPLS